jgi:hypothetical protein
LSAFSPTLPDTAAPEVRTVPVRTLNVATIRKIVAALKANEPPPCSATHLQACHLADVLPRKRCDETIAKAIRELDGVDFDTIAVRGVSGLLIGPVLAHLMGKELLVVRKDGERTASSYQTEGHRTILWYIIADDLVCTYSTAVHIHRAVKYCAPGAVLVGMLTYSNSVWFCGPDSPRVKTIEEYSARKDFTLVR